MAANLAILVLPLFAHNESPCLKTWVLLTEWGLFFYWYRKKYSSTPAICHSATILVKCKVKLRNYDHTKTERKENGFPSVVSSLFQKVTERGRALIRGVYSPKVWLIGHSFEKGRRKTPIEQHGLCQSSGLTGYHFMINLKGGGQVKRLL